MIRFDSRAGFGMAFAMLGAVAFYSAPVPVTAVTAIARVHVLEYRPITQMRYRPTKHLDYRPITEA